MTSRNAPSSSLQALTLNGAVLAVSWYAWLLIAAVFIVPIALAFVGDEEPDNSIRHESGEPRKTDQAEMGLAARART